MKDFEFFEETNFKQTEIGEIPEEFELVKYGDVVIVKNNGDEICPI